MRVGLKTKKVKEGIWEMSGPVKIHGQDNQQGINFYGEVGKSVLEHGVTNFVDG